MCVGDTHLQGLHQGLHCARQRRFGAQQGQPLPCRQGASSRHVEERERCSRSWLRNTPHAATRLSVEASSSPGYDSFSLLLSTVGISSPVSVGVIWAGTLASISSPGVLMIDPSSSSIHHPHQSIFPNDRASSSIDHPHQSIILINRSSPTIHHPHQSIILINRSSPTIAHPHQSIIDRSSSSNLGTAAPRLSVAGGIKQRGLEY